MRSVAKYPGSKTQASFPPLMVQQQQMAAQGHAWSAMLQELRAAAGPRVVGHALKQLAADQPSEHERGPDPPRGRGAASSSASGPAQQQEPHLTPRLIAEGWTLTESRSKPGSMTYYHEATGVRSRKMPGVVPGVVPKAIKAADDSGAQTFVGPTLMEQQQLKAMQVLDIDDFPLDYPPCQVAAAASSSASTPPSGKRRRLSRGEDEGLTLDDDPAPSRHARSQNQQQQTAPPAPKPVAPAPAASPAFETGEVHHP